MSGNAGSIGAIVLGVVLVVGGAMTGNPMLVVSGVMMVAGGAVGLAYQPKSSTQEQAKSQDLNVSPASVGNPVPVVFGTARVTPNWLRYSLEHFESREIYEWNRGGKGRSKQGPQLIGYEYFLRWELGICMGPVDGIGQIFSMPGEVGMQGGEWLPHTVIHYSSVPEVYMELSLSPRDENAKEGGLVRVYQGTADQVREEDGDVYASTGTPYRNICWALMGEGLEPFQLGMQPHPRTYQFIVRRWPKCVRDNGTVIEGLKTRLSDDFGEIEVGQANPAAIIYEVLTNKLWGRGLSSDLFDEASFIAVSEYFFERKIGMSFVLEAQDLVGDVLAGVFRHVKTMITWDGELYRCQCLLDQSFTHQEILTLTDRDLASFSVQVPFWETATVNEVRAEYLNANRWYRPDMVHAQDLANIEILGGRAVSERINLPAFADQNVAQKQVERILAEMSYPLMTATWEQNRFQSHLAVGQVVRIMTSDLTLEPVTSYWMILKIEDGASGNETLKVTAIQDQLLFPVAGEEEEVTVPDVHPWERLGSVDDSDVSLDDQPDLEIDPLDPVTAFELPAIATAGLSQRTAIIAEKEARHLLTIQGLWSHDDITYQSLGSQADFGISGTLNEPLNTQAVWDKSDAGIEFTVNNPGMWFRDLQAVNLIQADTEDLWRLLWEKVHWVVIGQELIQVGLIEQVSGATYRMRFFIRGRLGTKMRHHAVGTPIFYLKERPRGLNTAEIPLGWQRGIPVWFQAVPIGLRGPAADGVPFQPKHDGDNDEHHLGLGVRPLGPEPVSLVSDGGAGITIRVRPRFADSGAGVDSFEAAMAAAVGSIGAMSFYVAEIRADGTIIRFVPRAHTFQPGTLTSASHAQIAFSRHADALAFRVHSFLDGQASIDYAEFSL